MEKTDSELLHCYIFDAGSVVFN